MMRGPATPPLRPQLTPWQQLRFAGRGQLERQRPGTARTTDSPRQDKRANDSRARRPTHIRRHRTAMPTRSWSWLEPGTFGSRNGSWSLFDKFELFL
jgi:hypothetical protein